MRTHWTVAFISFMSLHTLLGCLNPTQNAGVKNDRSTLPNSSSQARCGEWYLKLPLKPVPPLAPVEEFVQNGKSALGSIISELKELGAAQFPVPKGLENFPELRFEDRISFLESFESEKFLKEIHSFKSRFLKDYREFINYEGNSTNQLKGMISGLQLYSQVYRELIHSGDSGDYLKFTQELTNFKIDLEQTTNTELGRKLVEFLMKLESQHSLFVPAVISPRLEHHKRNQTSLTKYLRFCPETPEL